MGKPKGRKQKLLKTSNSEKEMKEKNDFYLYFRRAYHESEILTYN